MKIVIFWFRRDLRFHDNSAFFHALISGYKVLPIFIFDKNILDKLPNKKDARVAYIHENLQKINKKFTAFESGIYTFYSNPKDAFEQLAQQFEIHKVFANEDYEPYAIDRDREIKTYLESRKIEFALYKDHVVFSPNEILKADGTPYTVYTPYSKKWYEKLQNYPLQNFPSEDYLMNLFPYDAHFHSLKEIGFEIVENIPQIPKITKSQITTYKSTRNIPSKNGTTKLSVHLRFGTVSIRKIVKETLSISTAFVNELIWREFFMQILFYFPETVFKAFKPKYDEIQWENDKEKFQKWCEGKTGYPIVDAGMRELNHTGFMHNRLRMIVASFLVKDLHIDWRWGEVYFAEKLLDYDQAQNVGNWQWAAGSGCDAAPYFRVFNPYLQQEKFDKEKKYIQKWIPELGTKDYPKEIVNHDEARKKTLEMYNSALKDK